MARIRKSAASKDQDRRIVWKIGKYIRLSREDGNMVSESVINQDKILTDELPSFFPDGFFEVVDTYIDDGTSGTTDIERESFQRMVADIKSGRINCIIVKNLSRAFRNSANQGHFLEEFLPLYGVRFISLYQPRMDTYLDSEVVHGLEVSITGFMNEQYAYKTSADVRRTFKHKMENGEFIGAFAPYGYEKDPQDKNSLLIDEQAAQVVRDMFTWFVAGMSKAGIAKKLNDLGVPNPTAYKRAKGFRYENPHAVTNDGLWSPATISRMLQDPLYIGTMRQGRQKVISYKVHRRTPVPENDWYVVENAIPAIVDKDLFDKAQSLHIRDTRTAPGKQELYLFSGFVRCPDCGKSMVRHSSRGYVYYHCRTAREKGRCSNHSIRLDVLEHVVLTTIQKQIELVASLSEIIEEINRASVVNTESNRLNALLQLRTKELEKANALLDGLYTDWKNGDITHDQYRRIKATTAEKVETLQAQVEHIKAEQEAYAKGVTTQDPYLSTFLAHRNIQSLTRGLLVELVDTIYIHEDGTVDIVFNFADQYRRIVEFIENNKNELHVIIGKTA